MAGRDRIIAGGERAAFEKMDQGLRYAIEAAVEINHYRGERGWMMVAVALEKTQQLVQQLKQAKLKSTSSELERIIREGRR